MNFINFNKNNQLTLLFSKYCWKKNTIFSQIKTFIGGTENDDIYF